jgi:hypothetical protein
MDAYDEEDLDLWGGLVALLVGADLERPEDLLGEAS